ncbi:hypothetical protein [Nocardioides fonticola]|uniref:hypothetical protein n=1 Tax=Nocardioides fonticola TaxID=450363 RepID=UPI0031D52401
MRRLLLATTGIAALAVVVATVITAVRQGVVPFLASEQCEASVDGHTVVLSIEQAENAALIAGIAVERGLPARAASIALATAFQESKLRNLDHGDRDSLGIFQQRPSQGWGTARQVRDPVYATNRFYDALVKVEGYTTLPITVAAQEVQRSAFPEAYADHERDARVLASALTGNSRAAFSCTVKDDPDAASPDLDAAGLTARAAAVRRDLTRVFGEQSLGGFAPGGVTSGHMPGSAHYDGRAVDVFFRPITPANRTRGWAMAQYLVAQAERLDIATVIFDDRIWTARRSAAGWRDYSAPSGSGDRAVLEHRDHVHVDVFA